MTVFVKWIMNENDSISEIEWIWENRWKWITKKRVFRIQKNSKRSVNKYFHHEPRIYFPGNYLHNSSSLRPTYKPYLLFTFC